VCVATNPGHSRCVTGGGHTLDLPAARAEEEEEEEGRGGAPDDLSMMIPRRAARTAAIVTVAVLLAAASSVLGTVTKKGRSSGHGVVGWCAFIVPPPLPLPSSSRHTTPAISTVTTTTTTTTLQGWVTANKRAGGKIRTTSTCSSSRRRVDPSSSSTAWAATRGSNEEANQGKEAETTHGKCSSVGAVLSSTSLHTHEFWSEARTARSIQEHVAASIRKVTSMLPAQDGGDSPAVASTVPEVDVLSSDPPLVVIHDFLTHAECEQIMDAAGKSLNGLQRSTTGAQQEVGTGRTSSTVWLRDGECRGPLRQIASKVSAVCGLPPSHMENLQVCKYLPGQEFRLHTDHQDSFNDLVCRGRLATCLIYLSCAAEGMQGAGTPATAATDRPRGGETWFPGVRSTDAGSAVLDDDDDDDGLSISPRQGSAVFFWNTMERPGMPGYEPLMFLQTDARLRHAGLPVLAGEKWICNRWVHPIDVGAAVRGV
jgi:prolyl 4-hydroxylase